MKRCGVGGSKRQKLLTDNEWKTPALHALDRLPAEIWQIVMVSCEFGTLYKLAATSKWFGDALRENACFWKQNFHVFWDKANWIHPIFERNPKKLIASNLVQKCFSCW